MMNEEEVAMEGVRMSLTDHISTLATKETPVGELVRAAWMGPCPWHMSWYGEPCDHCGGVDDDTVNPNLVPLPNDGSDLRQAELVGRLYRVVAFTDTDLPESITESIARRCFEAIETEERAAGTLS